MDGAYSLTATQTDAGRTVSLSSTPLLVTIDTSLPVTTPVSLTVQPNSGPALIGIALPTDPDDNFNDPNQAPTIVVFSPADQRHRHTGRRDSGRSASS